jgi:endonuclease IV
MPLFKGKDFPIEYIESRKYFEQTCKLAHQIGLLKKHNIIVVAHVATATSELRKLGILEALENSINDMLNKYDNIIIALENTTAFTFQRYQTWCPNTSVSIENGDFVFSNIELAKHINNERCGVCLDTCHALMDENNLIWLDTFFNYTLTDTLGKNNRFLNEVFKQSAPYLKLIHLSYVEGNGYGKSHGLPFTNFDYNDKSRKTLFHINELYKYHKLNCPITIEVCENNVEHAHNYTTTINTINNY